jgi:hypothetical protein
LARRKIENDAAAYIRSLLERESLAEVLVPELFAEFLHLFQAVGIAMGPAVVRLATPGEFPLAVVVVGPVERAHLLDLEGHGLAETQVPPQGAGPRCRVAGVLLQR